MHYRTVPLLICFMVMSALLAMFIDSITVILFLAAVTAELAKTCLLYTSVKRHGGTALC